MNTNQTQQRQPAPTLPDPLRIRLYLVAAAGYTSAKRGNPFWSRKQAMAAVVAASKL